MNSMKLSILVLLPLIHQGLGGLLGAGTGDGSCAAPPFRALAVQWGAGCPAHAPCCSEYGYCQARENWEAGVFRDCNGVSNGRPLEASAIDAENAAAAAGDAAGLNLLVVPAGASTLGGGSAAYIAAAAAAPAVVGYGGAAAVAAPAGYAGYAAVPAGAYAVADAYAAVPAGAYAVADGYAAIPAGTYATADGYAAIPTISAAGYAAVPSVAAAPAAAYSTGYSGDYTFAAPAQVGANYLDARLGLTY